MAQAVLSIRLDEDLKAQSEESCKKMGMSVSAAVKIFLTKLTNEHRMPFEITEDPFYSEENMKAIDRSVKQYENGEVVQHDLIEA